MGAFHAGQWMVEVSGDEGAETLSVRIRHAVKPLPLAGVALRIAGFAGQGGLCWQEVNVQRTARDEWIMQSDLGPGPEEWMLRWEGGAL